MDGEQFTELIRQHAGLIHKIAFAYCRAPTDRDDVVQEIAIQLWRSRERYDDRFKPTTWIYRIAINVAISYFRRGHRHRGGVPLEPSMLVAEPVEIGAELAKLLAYIDELDPLDKALVLLFLDDHDHATIAEVLGISVSNVGTKLARIKSKLRAAFDQGDPRAAR